MKKITILAYSLVILNAVFCQQPDKINQDWEKMHLSKSESLKKFNDNKFGMFIHFGVYSDLGGFWKEKEIKGIGECIMRYAEISRLAYREAASKFNPVKFDAEAWVLAAKTAGMRYIVAMPKHADGFAMYNSTVTNYDLKHVTHFDRDPMVELYQACRKHGINFSIYFNYLDWMDGGNGGVKDYEQNHPEEKKGYQYWANTWDPASVSFTDYLQNKYKPQLKELLEKFPGMQELWHDMPMKITREQSFDIYKMVYELQPGILENSRVGNDLGDFWIPGDNIIPEDKMKYQLNGTAVDPKKIKDLAWETPGTMNNTWGYRKDDHDWKSTDELLYWLIAITSKGGNYLLNIGPTGEGLFPEESLKRLNDIGDWMRINGKSIYGTHKWGVDHEGPASISINGTDSRRKKGFNANITSQDFWFSQKDNHLYITSLKWPEDKRVVIKSISKEKIREIKSVAVLGSAQKVRWQLKKNGLNVALPTSSPNAHGYVLDLTFK